MITTTLFPMSPSVHVCVHKCVRLCVLVAVIAMVAEATPHFFSDDSNIDDSLVSETRSVPEKRPARLSYFRSPYRASSPRRRQPWETLPNKSCYRQKCARDSDCCRRHSKCNSQARFCYDCWYGHPCRTSSDCCEKFPYCSPFYSTCQN